MFIDEMTTTIIQRATRHICAALWREKSVTRASSAAQRGFAQRVTAARAYRLYARRHDTFIDITLRGTRVPALIFVAR